MTDSYSRGSLPDFLFSHCRLPRWVFRSRATFHQPVEGARDPRVRIKEASARDYPGRLPQNGEQFRNASRPMSTGFFVFFLSQKQLVPRGWQKKRMRYKNIPRQFCRSGTRCILVSLSLSGISSSALPGCALLMQTAVLLAGHVFLIQLLSGSVDLRSPPPFLALRCVRVWQWYCNLEESFC